MELPRADDIAAFIARVAPVCRAHGVVCLKLGAGADAIEIYQDLHGPAHPSAENRPAIAAPPPEDLPDPPAPPLEAFGIKRTPASDRGGLT